MEIYIETTPKYGVFLEFYQNFKKIPNSNFYSTIPLRKFLFWNLKNQSSDVFPNHVGISNKKFVELKLEGITETQTILFKILTIQTWLHYTC